MMRLALLLACFGQAGCCCGSSHAVPDAGIDAGAGRDAGRDAGRRDSGLSDAGYRDVGVWGSGSCPTYHRGDGGFVRFGFLPDGCDVYRANAPEEVFGRLCWNPCRDGRAGCQELVAPAGAELTLDNYASGSHDGTRGYAYFIVWLDRNNFRVLARTDGQVLAVWRDQFAFEPSVCRGSARLGPTHAAFILRDGTLSNFPILYAPIGELGTHDTPLTTLGPAQTGGETSDDDFGSVSARYLAIEQGAGTITRTSIDGATDIIARGTIEGAPGFPYVVGSEVLFTQEGSTGRERILVAHADASTEVMRELPGADVKLVGADEREMVWLELSQAIPFAPYAFARMELWRAPFTADPSALRPARVARLPETTPQSSGALGFGHFVYLTGYRVRDVDLATGELFELTSPPPTNWSASPAYSGPDEWLASIGPSIGHPDTGSTLLRVRHDSLGPPVPRRGTPLPAGCPGPGCVLQGCPPRADCSTFDALRGASCGLAGYYCMCTGADHCVWYCGERFDDTGMSCAEHGLPTDF